MNGLIVCVGDENSAGQLVMSQDWLWESGTAHDKEAALSHSRIRKRRSETIRAGFCQCISTSFDLLHFDNGNN